MFDKVMVINRGEISRRIIRTLCRLGIPTLAVHSAADSSMPFVAEADEAVLIDGAPDQPYRDVEKLIEVAAQHGVDAVHPGYGFLSENAAAAARFTEVGLTWIGASAEVIELMGDKIRARNIAAGAGVPVAPGTTDPVTDAQAAVELAREIGYPIMVKASAGGGGMGMQVAEDEAQLLRSFEIVRGISERTFGSADVLLERYFPRVRHVEVQVLGLTDGTVLALGERDCSIQRRNQKLAEESPAPGLPKRLREEMRQAAVNLSTAISYRSAGTIEFLVDPVGEGFYFLEMNTRLQVEHPVTEAIFGVDLVEEMVRVAAGLPPMATELVPQGHAIEFRINAEVFPQFIPRPGVLEVWNEPSGEGIRVDSGYAAGGEVPPFYD